MAKSDAGFIAWLRTGQSSSSSINFTGVMDLADGVTVTRDENGTAVTLLSKKKHQFLRLKWLDHCIQIISGTFAFALLQLACERLRKNYYTQDTLLGYAMGSIAIIGGIAARLGLFCTRVLAEAIRLPFVLFSGVVGAVPSLFSSLSSGKSFLLTFSEYLWPFAPRVNIWIEGFYTTIKLLKDVYTDNLRSKRFSLYARYTKWLLPLAGCITLVVLLATGAGGIGVAGMPVLNAITGTIATVLAPVVGALGFTTTGTGAFAGFTLLNGFVVHGLGLGGLAKTILLGTMLVGAMSSVMYQLVFAVIENITALKKPPQLIKSDTDDDFHNESTQSHSESIVVSLGSDRSNDVGVNPAEGFEATKVVIRFTAGAKDENASISQSSAPRQSGSV